MEDEVMPKPSSNPFLFVGKTVSDEYGRQIGRIASFMVTPDGRINTVFVEHGDGEFLRYPNTQFRVNGSNIIILPSVKLKVKTLCDEIPLIWRKDQALKELSEKKRVSTEMFNDIHKSFEGALNQLKADAQATIDDIDKQMEKCAQQVNDLHSALVNLEIEREISRIDDESYQTAMGMIQRGLKHVNAEKTDLDAMRNKLSNIVLGDTSIASVEKETEKEAPAPQASTLPEPPVVVHVNPSS
jgi:hypothetical protein